MNMKTLWAVIIAVILVLVAAWAIDFDSSGDLEMPEIRADVDATGGELPDIDADTADIEVEEKAAQVDIPDVDVDMEEETFTYPDVDIQGPEEDTAAEPSDTPVEESNL